jgi:hypothetical protein
MSNNDNDSTRFLLRHASIGFLAYWIAVASFRCYTKGFLLGAIDMIWACNVALLLAVVATFLRSNRLINLTVGLVALTHLTWMIDVVAYAALRTMPLGRAKYMLWPDSTWLDNFSSMHHGWFVPCLLYLLYRNKGTLHLSTLADTFLASLVIGAVSLLVPKTVNGVYLNINLAHEMWKDLAWRPLHAYNPPDAHPLVYFCYMIVVINALNAVFYIPLLLLYNAIYREIEKLKC